MTPAVVRPLVDRRRNRFPVISMLPDIGGIFNHTYQEREMYTNYDRPPYIGDQAQGYGSALLAGFCFAIGSQLAHALWDHATDKLQIED